MGLIYEGHAEAGDPEGFGRLIYGYSSWAFIGYFQRGDPDFYSFTAKYGTGLFFKDTTLQYFGIYAEGAEFTNDYFSD